MSERFQIGYALTSDDDACEVRTYVYYTCMRFTSRAKIARDVDAEATNDVLVNLRLFILGTRAAERGFPRREFRLGIHSRFVRAQRRLEGCRTLTFALKTTF